MEPFIVRPPVAEAIPLVVSIPHTGTGVPDEVASRFCSAEIAGLPMTDWHLHRLYDFLPELGVTTIYATWSRFVVDLNRAPESQPLYPGRFETGLVPLETFQGEPIFDCLPDHDEIERLRRRYYQPYHDRLNSLLLETRARFDRAVLVDAHSIASAPTLLHDALTAEIYLGNRDGATCDSWLVDCLARSFLARGLAVTMNQPYKGGYITDHYGRQPWVDAIQIEMCQRVYMDEADPAGAPAHARFSAARRMLEQVFVELVDRIRVDQR